MAEYNSGLIDNKTRKEKQCFSIENNAAAAKNRFDCKNCTTKTIDEMSKQNV